MGLRDDAQMVILLQTSLTNRFGGICEFGIEKTAPQSLKNEKLFLGGTLFGTKILENGTGEGLIFVITFLKGLKR